MSYYHDDELRRLGLASVGRNVRVSRLASIHGAARISIGDHSRIDDFCVLSAGAGGIRIGRHVHLAVHCCLMGQGEIRLDDFSGLSSRVTIYSSNDDYSGEHMSNPTVPPAFTNVTSAPVHLERHVIVGSGSVVLPGCTLHEGSGVGALSLVREDCEAFGMYFGSPVRRIGRRSTAMIALGDTLDAQQAST